MGIIILGMAAPWRAGAETVAASGFEDPGALGDIAGTAQQIAWQGALTNEAGRHNVAYATGGAGSGIELGFTTSWLTNGNSAADGIGPVASTGDTLDLIGVTDNAPTGTNFTQGAFGFVFDDADGELTLAFDAVDFSGYANPALSLDLFVRSDTWETGDYLRVLVSAPGTNMAVFDSMGLDIDNLGIEGAWTHLSASLDGFPQASLSVVFSSNADGERAWIDNVIFSATAIPEPSAALLFGGGCCVLSLAFRRRRRQC